MRPRRARWRGRTQGRPRGRASNPVISRAPEGVCRKWGQWREPQLPKRAPIRTWLGRGGGTPVNLLVVGLSHHTAPVELLERLAVTRDETPELLSRLISQPYVNEVAVLSTCNRVEVYAAVSAFHGGLAEIGAVLAERAGLDISV